ncbi:hypothetical protein ACQVTS_30450 [Bacillus mycoides]|uniref:hypothetical protein n=1 Tax=Bacillus mycoides TaxID=1405 RepID=UPI003D64C6B2
MKKHRKKMFKHTLIGSAMLMGFLISEGHSAFAQELPADKFQKKIYDSNKNEVDSNSEYYLVPINDSNSGVVATDWSGGKWGKIGPLSHALTVKLKPVKSDNIANGGNYDYSILLGGSNRPIIGVQLETNVKVPSHEYDIAGYGQTRPITYLKPGYLNTRSNGVELNSYSNKTPTIWNVETTPSIDTAGNHITNYVSFKDTSSKKYLIYNDWLYVDQPSKFGQNQWQLIKK